MAGDGLPNSILGDDDTFTSKFGSQYWGYRLRLDLTLRLVDINDLDIRVLVQPVKNGLKQLLVDGNLLDGRSAGEKQVFFVRRDIRVGIGIFLVIVMPDDGLKLLCRKPF